MARACFKEEAAVPAVIHQKLMELFKYYLIVGGMPAAVARFAQTRDIAQVQSVQKDILKLYRADIVKYARNKAHVGAIFDAIPAELSKKNKRFKLSDLAKSARSERYESDFIWLADADVAIPCYNVTELVAPLRLNRQHSVFKLFLCDTGLLVAMLGDGCLLYTSLRRDPHLLHEQRRHLRRAPRRARAHHRPPQHRAARRALRRHLRPGPAGHGHALQARGLEPHRRQHRRVRLHLA